MALEPNGTRFFQAPVAATAAAAGSLFPLTTNTSASAPKDASGLFSTQFTRDLAQKTRLEPHNFQATGQGVSGLGSTAQTARNVAPGFEGFSRPRNGVALPPVSPSPVPFPVFSLAAARSKAASTASSNVLFPLSRVDTVTASRQDLAQPKPPPPQQILPPAGFPFNGATRPQGTQVQKQIVARPPSRSAVTRSSTPAHDISRSEGDPSSVDYIVFQSLLESQKRRDVVLKEKEELLLQKSQEVTVLYKKNLELTTELERTKEKTKAYIRQCDKLHVAEI